MPGGFMLGVYLDTFGVLEKGRKGGDSRVYRGVCIGV